MFHIIQSLNGFRQQRTFDSFAIYEYSVVRQNFFDYVITFESIFNGVGGSREQKKSLFQSQDYVLRRNCILYALSHFYHRITIFFRRYSMRLHGFLSILFFAVVSAESTRPRFSVCSFSSSYMNVAIFFDAQSPQFFRQNIFQQILNYCVKLTIFAVNVVKVVFSLIKLTIMRLSSK